MNASTLVEFRVVFAILFRYSLLLCCSICLVLADDMVDSGSIDLKLGALDTPVVADLPSSSSSSADVSFVPPQHASLLSNGGGEREHKNEPVVPAVPEHSQSQPGTGLFMLPIVAPHLLCCLAY